eukprot:CAMPEP_0172577874 /NCGR_PEP_ID=MMETSP1067-20121228/138452_1 /TAXON_ID=265564 ORGANISM="Thalassiosira punctigera, Strain Tpunct2005C2" /NCGR_SAMPLE_ID=MMETSP1067 /ASSEMBLY_ACC=CAM_ASM_000444 /LENGTH=353 /DNA_ID=CAMNT_0013370565 /DNA_START=8 /DNA_END=1069 /DNA_ORIENTATION=-
MGTSNSDSSDDARTKTPLSYESSPLAPRQLFALRLRVSSHLFPKTFSSPRMKAGDNSNRKSAADEPRKKFNHAVGGGKNQNTKEKINISKSCLSSEVLRPNHKKNNHGKLINKKSVRFDCNNGSCQLDIPRASDMSTKEKRARWYGANEYDQFKYEAAKHAGVKIVWYDSENVGHFDLKPDNDARSTSKENESGVKKLYYNENEYNDTRNSNGEAICKRGLGYHFSRNRQKSSAATRSAVMAWQKTLKDPANRSGPKFQESSPSPGGESKRNSGEADKTRAMLALLSAKWSRLARMEAKWRGDVDYGVAYPEAVFGWRAMILQKWWRERGMARASFSAQTMPRGGGSVMAAVD